MARAPLVTPPLQLMKRIMKLVQRSSDARLVATLRGPRRPRPVVESLAPRRLLSSLAGIWEGSRSEAGLTGTFGRGTDMVEGSDGSDTCCGGEGTDTVMGGADADTFMSTDSTQETTDLEVGDTGPDVNQDHQHEGGNDNDPADGADGTDNSDAADSGGDSNARTRLATPGESHWLPHPQPEGMTFVIAAAQTGRRQAAERT